MPQSTLDSILQFVQSNANFGELEKLQADIKATRIQTQHLERSIVEEEELKKRFFPNQIQIVEQYILLHLGSVFKSDNLKDLVKVLPVYKSKTSKCDMQCPIGAKLFAVLSIDERNLLKIQNVQDCTDLCFKSIPENEIFNIVKVLPSGTLQMDFKKMYVSRLMKVLFENGINPPQIQGGPKRILIEMSSPNIAKEMHVGHLRSTIIGESLSRLNEFLGNVVSKVNHIGDWGTQFGMLITYIKRQQDLLVSFDTDKFDTVSAPALDQIQNMYKEAKVLFDKDEDFSKLSLANVVKLQNKDAQCLRIWKNICNLSMEKFNSIYDQLGVKNLITKGESTYQEEMERLSACLARENITEVDECGREVLYCQDAQIPLIIKKSDGAFTYDTSDLATIAYRLKTSEADKILYVVDMGQQLHFDCLFKAAEKIKLFRSSEEAKSKVEHIEFGLVLDSNKKKFKTRSGETVKLQDLIDEGCQKSYESLCEKKGRDVVESNPTYWKSIAENIAIGSIIYSDLSNRRHVDYVFSFERMLNDRGNTAVYLLYSYVRIQSILRKCEQIDAKIKQKISKSVSDGSISGLLIECNEALTLSKHITIFTNVLKLANDTNQLNGICEYVYILSGLFSDFYCKFRIIQDDSTVNLPAAALCQLTASMIQKMLWILAIKTVDRI